MAVVKKVLISTIQPVSGGVPAMLGFVIESLQRRHCQITIAYYQPYSVSPHQSVPFYKLPFATPSNSHDEFMGEQCIGIGCWLPEFEFTHYWATKSWCELIQNNDIHLAVSGSALAALPYYQTETHFMAWVATDWLGDRLHRVRKFPLYRRLLDKTVATPIIKRLEKRLIRSGNLIALSEHTQKELNSLVGDSLVEDVLPMPIETDHFVPSATTSAYIASQQKASNDSLKIGFMGRYEDPRKHLSLLLDSFALIAQQHDDVELVLVGDEMSESSRRRLDELGIIKKVTVMPYVEKEELPAVLQQWDLFVLPSFQEGLCIAALEAMSCGVPVISTRCGGPEDYIVDGENGILCDHNVDDLAAAILKLLSNQELRLSYASRAREVIIEQFDKEKK